MCWGDFSYVPNCSIWFKDFRDTSGMFFAQTNVLCEKHVLSMRNSCSMCFVHTTWVLQIQNMSFVYRTRVPHSYRTWVTHRTCKLTSWCAREPTSSRSGAQVGRWKITSLTNINQCTCTVQWTSWSMIEHPPKQVIRQMGGIDQQDNRHLYWR